MLSIPPQATKIALELKKQLVDSNRLDITQVRSHPCLHMNEVFKAMQGLCMISKLV
jgi:hypothetical protein